MAQKSFGGSHTVKKLDRLEAYLRAFLTAFKKLNWAHTVYFDAFAGTGEVPLPEKEAELPLDLQERRFIEGSVTRALKLELSFHEYIFVEKKKRKAMALLSKLKAEWPERSDIISVRSTDANTALIELCQSKDWRNCRAVVFLDPFGSQVDWSTIKALAETQAVDLWYLFPAGLSVNRQIGANGSVHYTHEASITRLLGTEDWKFAFLDRQQAAPDLFGHAEASVIKTATPESVTRFMIERMKAVFAGGVSDEWLPLGRNQGHWYSLIFACSNPSPKASALALKLAKAVLRTENRGRTK